MNTNIDLTTGEKGVIIPYEKIVREKNKIRKTALKQLKSQKRQDRRKKSLAIKKKLFSREEFKNAANVLLYAAKSYEVDTIPIIKEAIKKGKKVFLPLTNVQGKRLTISQILDMDKDTHIGPWGIYQPKDVSGKYAPPADIDLCVVPGVAFDKKGNRLGHGGGYYDKFLKDIPRSAYLIGLAFDFQIKQDGIPALAKDIPVNRVITN